MHRLRSVATALWLALALLLGQQAAALHGLQHASERLQQQDKSTPAQQTCDQCFHSAQLSGAVGARVATLEAVAPEAIRPRLPQDRVSPAPARFAFQSRAPPALA